jgi:mannose-1-phosphate guanylyltransferase / mannose-6-phosphate isomerase
MTLSNRSNLFAVILAGGSGTRFWPLSRESHPKQMLQIIGEGSLLCQTIKRLEGLVLPENIYIITTKDLTQDIHFHIQDLGGIAGQIKIISEPVGRNTAPAIGLASALLNRLDPDSSMIVLPADHLIKNVETFHTALRSGLSAAQEGYLVTLGIKPRKPETAYGYIKKGDPLGEVEKGLFRVSRFVEKPDLEKARFYVEEGDYYWNAGIFIWKTGKLLSEIERHLPSLSSALKKMQSLFSEKAGDLSADNLELAEIYSSLESVSIDYGVLEKSREVVMVPSHFDWSDLGNWTALDEVFEKDGAGNIFRGNTIDFGSQDSIVFGGERVVATIGLKDMVLVDTPDATLVSSKERVQEVRKVVEKLKKEKREEYLLHRTVFRPWGSYTVLEKGPGYKIKRIVVKPGTKLSLQVHHHRSEHWVVISGTAKVTRANETYFVHPHESTYIPISTKHRLENGGHIPLQIIEIQNGEYLEEDDIERFDDDYNRR